MIALWVAAWAAGPSVLDDPAFRFCHRPTPGDFDDTFCEVLEGLPPDRCPGLRALCADPDAARAAGCGEAVRGGANWGSTGSTPSAPDGEDEPPLEMPTVCGPAPAAAATVFGWVVAMVVVLGLAALLAVILRTLGLRSDGRPPPVARPIAEETEEQAFAQAVDDVPDLPSEDLLSAARQARDGGRLGEAAILARGAVLRRLGEQKVLRLHRARTDREYVRMAEPGVQPDLDVVFTAAERHRWGRVPLDRERLDRALAAAARLITLGALLLVAPAAWGLDRYGPAGDLGLRRVLERHGHDVRFRAEPLDELTADDPVDLLLIDRSGLAPTPADWTALRQWVEAGGVLWVAGTVVGFPELGEPASVEDLPGLTPELLAEGLTPPRWPAGSPSAVDGGEAWTVPDDAGGAAMVGAAVGEGYVLMLGEPLLFWNGALVDPANEAFLGEVPYRLQARGYAANTPIRIELATRSGASDPDDSPPSLANLRLLPFVIQLLILWVAVVAWRGWPFTRLADPPERGRLRFVDHVDAVARQYRQRRASGHVLKAYALWALETCGRSGLLLAARRHGASAAEAEALVARAEAAARAERPTDSPSDLELLEELWKLTRPR